MFRYFKKWSAKGSLLGCLEDCIFMSQEEKEVLNVIVGNYILF